MERGRWRKTERQGEMRDDERVREEREREGEKEREKERKRERGWGNGCVQALGRTNAACAQV